MLVCAFPYILAFTTDSIEIRLVVNGNLVYTAVVPELQLTASRVSLIDRGKCPIMIVMNLSYKELFLHNTKEKEREKVCVCVRTCVCVCVRVCANLLCCNPVPYEALMVMYSMLLRTAKKSE